LANHGGDESGIDRRLLGLVSEPVRLRVLVLLNERPASVGEVAEKLNLSTIVAARHLESLHDADLIEVVGEVLHRGAVEPRYRALVRAIFGDEELAALSFEDRRRLTGWIVDLIHADAHEALDSGLFPARLDSHVSRSVFPVDEQGWKEINQIQEDALEAIFTVQEASAERLAEHGAEGLTVMSAMFCCELPGSLS
jgi:DNA-binding transcriptional ArsR family regulator